MFIEQYKLERNPFAPNVARPTFASHSMRYAFAKLDELIHRQIYCLFLSGPAGVGKTSLVRQRLRGLRDVTVSWINSGADSREAMLAQLVTELGPGAVEASPAEIGKILEVFLRHQAAKGHHSLVVADAVERFSGAALREIETLAQLRLRGRPMVSIVMITRNEDLLANMLTQYDAGPLARAVHQRLNGFTLDETRAYVRTCLRGAGCDWAEELVPDDVIVDIQAFTQGLVGDINTLCCASLEAVAERSVGRNRQPKVTRAVLKEAGTQLNLRYDPAAWAPVADEPLLPAAVQVSDPSDLELEAARLTVTSGRQVVAEVWLNRPRMVLGRDASCDISLDSRYVSRYQNLFMETAEGWVLIDLGSTNGCFVNGRRVREHRLRDGDLIAVGHHHLRFSGPQGAALGRTGAHAAVAVGSQEDTLVVAAPKHAAVRPV